MVNMYFIEDCEETIYDKFYKKSKNIVIHLQYATSCVVSSKNYPVIGKLDTYGLCKSDKIEFEKIINIEQLNEITKNEKDIDKEKFEIRFTDYNIKHNPITLSDDDKNNIFNIVKLYVNSKCNRSDFFGRIEKVLKNNTIWKTTKIWGNEFRHFNKGYYYADKEHECDVFGVYIGNKTNELMLNVQINRS